ncbi:histidinol dehydrogenase [candidate division WOR-1 bacterium RIFCSPHIGHO2_01_FULL_53_15]|uniref:Histidinol dehydrogenase n=1 Tax=candidate division WOR-1 bacterium RIFCSPHIGHO2_01_FULL_53_15 TaxID=1802564 RepID=A0A1F4Q3P1_UNCSA|nr:MAG: histidinol dehydrogenase [candidate division WOR-1 bacterium RIFCSPHIGHO2_01_FULL_53_15]OGC13110.1 MAG: histidinol dehydrogenase [candidate division WOR-1 bacterium RIFCSPHIGHO2_02_FULL_53_26]
MLKIIPEGKNEAEIERLIKKKTISADLPQEKVVNEIIEAVRAKGDEALFEYTKKFDGEEIAPDELKVTDEEIKKAYKKVKEGFFDSLTKAIQNITAYHRKQKSDEWFETLPLDVVLGQRLIPLTRVGVYVPGGRATYPSSVLMNVIPAKVADVKEIILVSPPPISPYILVAAAEVGVSAIYKVGGAQAIAALAYGTQTVPKVDKIVGPGNIYVTLAKKAVFGTVGIESLAGPSDVVIIADSDADAEFIAADLLAQAEHDPSSSAVLITNSEKVLEKVEKEVAKQLPKLARKKIIEEAEIVLMQTETIGQAIELSNRIAPEHLELEVGSPQRVLEKIKNAGAVFLGPHSPVAVGDYIAGPNHVLPTGGTARFASPLGVYDFVKHQSIIGYTKPALKNVWKDVKLLAEIEGLDAHARSIDVRFS